MSGVMDLKKVILFIIVIFYGFKSYRDEKMHVGHQEGNLWIAAGVGGLGTGECGNRSSQTSPIMVIWNLYLPSLMFIIKIC